jgi:PAS domain S-box-containing protein
MLTTHHHASLFLTLARAIGQTRTVDDIYTTALDALADALGVERSSILLFDPDGVMRFKASRGISERYRAAVEGHTPWSPGTRGAVPIVVQDVGSDRGLAPYLPVIRSENIAAMAFIPLVIGEAVIGKFMLYFDSPRSLGDEELQIASAIAALVAFAVERTRTEAQARRSEERLRFALDAASMGTWDWDLISDRVEWSDNLERIHGLPANTFDGSFASYEREIHPEDRDRVLASARRAIAEGTPHEVEYRIVAPDGTVRWCEGKGNVEYDEAGRPVRMSGVCMIVSRRKEAELARLAAAEEANRLKDEFLATLSHELRTPLNAILGWVQILQTESLGPDRARQAIDVIGRNARLQGQLIEDILDVSRIITGKLRVERAPLSIGPLLEAAVAGVAPVAEARGIVLTKSIAADLPPVQGDTRRLHQVVGNVLANALKFTPAGGRVAVTCSVTEGGVQIEVADTGVGIEPEFQPYIFERFRQADSRSTRRHGGLGLGLAIARYLVEQHDGTISAHSDGVGRGTTVTIVLPADISTPGEDLLVPAGGVHSAVRLDGKVVMIVDDEADSRDMLASLVESRGATVVRCESTADALDRIAAAPTIDLLVADIAMPDADGYELIQRLRATMNRTPAIAVTAFARFEDHIRALEAGYDGYCAKPIDVGHLLGAMERLLGAAARYAD